MAPADRNLAVVRARELRRSMTLPEGLLWQVLRKRPDGLKFRRQHPLAPYIVDFYCPAARLVIEIDGESHGMDGRPEHDARRDRWLREQGFKVLRFAVGDVFHDIESVVAKIILACRG